MYLKVSLLKETLVVTHVISSLLCKRRWGVSWWGGGGRGDSHVRQERRGIIPVNQGVVKALIEPKDTLLDRIPNGTAIITLIVVRYCA